MKVYYEYFSKDKLYKEDFYNEIIEELDITESKVENIFSSGKYYFAMKKLNLLQKQVLYYLIIKNYNLDELSLYLKISKEEIVKIKQKAIEEFKKNLNYKENKNE